MPNFSFTEKEWDKVRPSSLKHTGVSKAMRDVLKGVPKDVKALSNASDCDKAIALLKSLDTALSQAAGQIKPKDDKKDATGRIKAWRSEINENVESIEEHKEKLVLAVAQRAAEAKMNTLLEKLESKIAEAKKLKADIARQVKSKSASDIDATKLSMKQMDFRTVERDARAAVTKRGFVHYIMQLDEVMKNGVNPNDIELPAVADTIKSKTGELVKLADEIELILRAVMTRQSEVDGDSMGAEACRELVDEYKESLKTFKSLSAQGKTLAAKAKQLADSIKGDTGMDTSKALAATHKLHTAAIEYHEKVLAESYRSRDRKGDLSQKHKIAARLPGWEKEVHGKLITDWVSTVFTVFRTCTIAAKAMHNQVDRAVDTLTKVGGTTTSQAESMARNIAADRQKLAAKYGAAF